VDGKVLTLGISGYLYRSAVLYYDSETESFWSQMTGHAVVGPQTGKRLKWLATVVTTWKEWKAEHPETTVLEPVFALDRYRRTRKHYDRYFGSGKPWFPTGPHPVAPDHEPMDPVTILHGDGKGRCYPHKALAEGVNEDGAYRIEKRGETVRVRDTEGKEVPTLTGFWFAWCAFYPEGTVYKPGK
jgi:hypothetical protein